MARVHSLAKIGNPIGIGKNATAYNPYHLQVNAVGKNNELCKYCISNEYIGSEMGRFLGLPIPPCGLVYLEDHNQSHWFASLNFNMTATQLPPVDPEQVISKAAFLATGVIMFDILIANGDRNRRNLYFDMSDKPPRLSVFDHSHSLFGIENGKGLQRLTELKEALGIAPHCLLNWIPSPDHFSDWYERIESLPNYLIDSTCECTVGLEMISLDEANAAKEFLRYRRDNIRKIVKTNRAEFLKIETWGLFE